MAAGSGDGSVNGMMANFADTEFDVSQYTQGQFKKKDEAAITEHLGLLGEEKERAAEKLKLNVFKNYPQFIGASNDISSMEMDLADLGAIIGHMRDVLSDMKEAAESGKRVGGARRSPHAAGSGGAGAGESDAALHERRRAALLRSQWAFESLCDLDALVAERDFDGAVALIGDIRKKSEAADTSAAVRAVVLRAIAARQERLAARLIDDLKDPTLPSARRAALVNHLAGFGQADRARDVYFAAQSKWLKLQIRRLKFAGDVPSYASELSRVLVRSLSAVCDEFDAVFATPMACGRKAWSSFVVWATGELGVFAQVFRRQVFHAGSFAVIADCLESTYSEFAALESKGLCLDDAVRMSFQPQLAQAIESQCARIESSLGMRVDAEAWRGREAHLPGVTLRLTDSAKFLYNELHRFSRDVGRVLSPDLYMIVNTAIAGLVERYLGRLAQAAYADDLTDAQSLAIAADVGCVTDDLLPRIARILQRRYDRPMHGLLRAARRLSATHDVRAMRLHRHRALLTGRWQTLLRSYAAQRANALLGTQMAWDRHAYAADAAVESALEEWDRSRGDGTAPAAAAAAGGSSLVVRPTRPYTALVEFLCQLRVAAANYLGPDRANPVVASVAEEVAARLGTDAFWARHADIARSALHALVVDARFLLHVLGPMATPQAIEFVEALIGRGLMDHCRSTGADPRHVLMDDAWFLDMAIRGAAALPAQLTDPLPGDLTLDDDPQPLQQTHEDDSPEDDGAGAGAAGPSDGHA